MKKFIFLVLILWCAKVDAYVELGETYTGKYTHHANDYGLGDVPNGYNFLGGPIGNNSVTTVARQLITNGHYSVASYLSVSGLLKPSLPKFENYKSEYLNKLDKQNMSSKEIKELLDSFVGPQQEMEVDFSIIKGSRPYVLALPGYVPIPSNEIISTGKYKFMTENSKFDKNFSGILVPLSPFETPLDANQDYWIRASQTKLSGTTFYYNTKLYGEVTTPEPATFLLLGGGLLVALRRKKTTGNPSNPGKLS